MEDMYYETDSIQVDQRDMKEAVLDLKVRTMRDNLLFLGIPEMPGEYPPKVIKKFVKHDLKCERDIQLVRAHMTGPRLSSRLRTPVSKFANFDERWQVLTSTHALRDTPYGISEQFPTEIVHRRKKLPHIFKEARRRVFKANLTVDKLYINDRRWYHGDKHSKNRHSNAPPFRS